MISMSILSEGFAEAQRMLSGIKNGFPRATAEAINRGLISGRKVAVKGIRARYNIKSGQLKAKGMEVKKASSSRLEGSLDSRGTMLPITMFNPTVKKEGKRGKKRSYVAVAILKGKRKIIKGAFKIGDGRIMERRQPSQYPIFPVSTIGVPHMLGYLNISKQVEDTIANTTMTRLRHNTDLFLAKGKASFR